MTDQKVQSPAISCSTVAARRDSNATTNVTSQVFNAFFSAIKGLSTVRVGLLLRLYVKYVLDSMSN